MDSKLCGRCQRTQPVSEFYPAKTRRDGLSPWCITCGRETVNASYLKLRASALEHLGGACRSCGYDADSRALVIDHVHGGGRRLRLDGTTHRRQLHAAMIDEEGEYQLLCANCNIIKREQNGEARGRVYTRELPPLAETDSKRCSRCQQTKTRAEFGRNGARHDGLTVYCTPCVHAYTTERYRTLRAQALKALGGMCVDCGFSDERALQIDHVNGDGAVDRRTGNINTKRLKSVLTDTEGRYQLLCTNCNTIKRIRDAEQGSREYVRNIPTERIDRPHARWTPESRAAQSEQQRKLWQDPEHRAAMSKDRSERMKRRWASGEVPNRRKPKPPVT